MKRNTTIAIGVLLLAACNGGGTNPDTMTMNDTGADPSGTSMNTSVNTAMPDMPMEGAATTAAAYVSAAGLSDLYEIESSRLAVQRAQSEALKRFARQMITDHQATTQQITQAASEADITAPPPTALDPRRAGLVDALRQAADSDFDRLYREQQLTAHREALALHRSFASDGDAPALKAAAGSIAPKVQNHLTMLENMAADAGTAAGS